LGRDRCVFSEAGHQVQTGRRLQLARELRGAEVRGEMRLAFQPVFALRTMEIVGVEALLRWKSPTFGEIAPVEFIPIAEHTATIVPIGAWVLRESCETMARLAGLGHHLELDVNVSAFQLSMPDFPLWVRQTLAHAEFPAGRLGLEITETALMRPDAITTHNLRELDALGVRIVLDDFGTGYSSLSWLKQHPFGAIKIDRSFVSGLPDDKNDRAIVAGVIGMAKALDCTVTAEGVENRGAARHLAGTRLRPRAGFHACATDLSGPVERLADPPLPTRRMTAITEGPHPVAGTGTARTI
jgi:EAL domain-containing protein (putative c-di-GMP-specific phosphodiesterase class I)